MAPEATWQALSPSLYIAFWSLRLCDIHAAASGYKSSSQALADAARQAQSNRASSGGGSGSSNNTSSDADKIKVRGRSCGLGFSPALGSLLVVGA